MAWFGAILAEKGRELSRRIAQVSQQTEVNYSEMHHSVLYQ